MTTERLMLFQDTREGIRDNFNYGQLNTNKL